MPRSKDDEVRAVTAQLDGLVTELSATVAALTAILVGPAPAADGVLGGAAP